MNAVLVILHVLGASIWAGGHLVLALGFLPAALRARDPQIILGFEARYERIGLPALVIQAVTGVLLALPYLPEAGETMSGHVAGSLGLKVVLLLATVALAIHARLRLVPRLTPETLRPLAVHIVAVTIIAVLLVILGVAIRLAPA
jgi:putative copper export protein